MTRKIELPKISKKKVLEMIGDIPVKDMAFECGMAGEVTFEGGCGKEVAFVDAFRCTDCTVYFHRKCARKHFGQDINRKDWKEEPND